MLHVPLVRCIFEYPYGVNHFSPTSDCTVNLQIIKCTEEFEISKVYTIRLQERNFIQFQNKKKEILHIFRPDMFEISKVYTLNWKDKGIRQFEFVAKQTK